MFACLLGSAQNSDFKASGGRRKSPGWSSMGWHCACAAAPGGRSASRPLDLPAACRTGHCCVASCFCWLPLLLEIRDSWCEGAVERSAQRRGMAPLGASHPLGRQGRSASRDGQAAAVRRACWPSADLATPPSWLLTQSCTSTVPIRPSIFVLAILCYMLSCPAASRPHQEHHNGRASCARTRRDSRGTASSHGPLMAALNLWMRTCNAEWLRGKNVCATASSEQGVQRMSR